MNNQVPVQRPTVDELSHLLHTVIRILSSVPNPNGRAVRIQHLVNEAEFISGYDVGRYAVWSLPVSDYEVNMKPTKSKGPSKDKVGTVERTVFERSGRLIARVKI